MTILPRPRLAIIGSGIGGLAFAVVLSKLGLDETLEIDVYESTAKLAPVGAGISIWPRAWDILRKMGLEKALSERSPPSASAAQGKKVSGFSYRKSDQKQGVPIVEVKLPCGPRAFHRADMQEALLKHTSSLIRFHFCHRLKKYSETSNGIELTFWNGKNVTCDLLIGADGINSTVRALFLEDGNGDVECSRPRWTGTIAYRSLVEAEDVRKVNPRHPALERYMVYCGKNKHIVMYPIMQGRYVNTIQFITDPTKEGTYLSTPAVVDLSEDDIPKMYSGWEDDAQCIVKLIAKPSKWAIQTVGPLDKYASECVVLLGDAAHGMAPHLGNGAAQAIEDAYVLANLLAAELGQGRTCWDTKKITDAYNLVRQPFGNFVVNATRQQGRRYDLNTPALEAVNEGDYISPCELADLGRSIEEGWEWTWNTSVNGDLERALAVL